MSFQLNSLYPQSKGVTNKIICSQQIFEISSHFTITQPKPLSLLLTLLPLNQFATTKSWSPPILSSRPEANGLDGTLHRRIALHRIMLCSDGIPSFIQRKEEVSCNWVDSSSSLAVAVSRHANKLVSTRRTRSSKLSPSLPPIYPFYYMPRRSSPVSRALGSSDSIAKRVEDQLMIRSCRIALDE